MYRQGAARAPVSRCAGILSSARRWFSLATESAEKKLFTPGPLNTSAATKQAMLRDLGSRDVEFVQTVAFIRRKLVELAGLSTDLFTCVPVQGSGTYALESVLTTTVPRQGGRVLALTNGAYGERSASICRVLGIDVEEVKFPEDETIDVQRVRDVVSRDQSFTNVSIVHCETTSGVVNSVEEVGRLVKQMLPNAAYFVDTMSSFGGMPLDLEAAQVDYMVSSCNKCLESVPGFSYVLANSRKLLACKGWSRSVSLDLVAQYNGLETNGQFRFTPPTHAMLALKQALKELDVEGGIEARAKRYQQNRKVLQIGMAEMGFKEYLDSNHQGYIITSYRYPSHPNFSFNEFYQRLNNKGMVIYPGKVTKADCFRIGNIGHLFSTDMDRLLLAIRDVCKEMNIDLPLQH
ncbi:2-aminoethylphosphonate--pyruvate transaminase-like [Corticium candelabrum]|uniref:2-aminoethylphosphonate--pyruvate transaminase-like n=1 Tax=Corticium candelabrum TaxID=121492 RepID=UPI002E26E822|nr:2-aminoethylphosphonate--pyruvate transaminase-like [Corticium candelabrum]